MILSTASTATTATTAIPEMGARSAPRQWLIPTGGAACATAWLWRCVALADDAGLTAAEARLVSSSGRRHLDAYRVTASLLSLAAMQRWYHVVYTPTATPHTTPESDAAMSQTRAHDGFWRCACPKGHIGAACAHIGAAYLLACQRDAERDAARAHALFALSTRLRQTQAQATALDERLSAMKQSYYRQVDASSASMPAMRQFDAAISYYEQRYRALASQMAALITAAATALATR